MAHIKTASAYTLTLSQQEAEALLSALMPYDDDIINPIFCALSDEANIVTSHSAFRISDGSNIWADTLGLREK